MTSELTCRCGTQFTFTAEEQECFLARNFLPPKRCHNCRLLKKLASIKDVVSPVRSDDDAEISLHDQVEKQRIQIKILSNHIRKDYHLRKGNQVIKGNLNVICRDFRDFGICKYGSNCKFKHICPQQRNEAGDTIQVDSSCDLNISSESSNGNYSGKSSTGGSSYYQTSIASSEMFHSSKKRYCSKKANHATRSNNRQRKNIDVYRNGELFDCYYEAAEPYVGPITTFETCCYPYYPLNNASGTSCPMWSQYPQPLYYTAQTCPPVQYPIDTFAYKYNCAAYLGSNPFDPNHRTCATVPVPLARSVPKEITISNVERIASKNLNNIDTALQSGQASPSSPSGTASSRSDNSGGNGEIISNYSIKNVDATRID